MLRIPDPRLIQHNCTCLGLPSHTNHPFYGFPILKDTNALAAASTATDPDQTDAEGGNGGDSSTMPLAVGGATLAATVVAMLM
jgi:hypothetical protein